MKETEDDPDDTKQQSEGSRLRLVPTAGRERLRPEPKLKTLLDELKGVKKRGRVRLSFDDDPDAA
jgi:hypothetical protein